MNHLAKLPAPTSAEHIVDVGVSAFQFWISSDEHPA
jgi:hypothetical protein